MKKNKILGWLLLAPTILAVISGLIALAIHDPAFVFSAVAVVLVICAAFKGLELIER